MDRLSLLYVAWVAVVLINAFMYIITGNYFPVCNGLCLNESLRSISNGCH